MIIPEPLPPLPYLPEGMAELVERYEALRAREVEARNAIPRARAAIGAAEDADREEQAQSIRDGGTARDVGWPARDAAIEALADAEAEHDAVYSLIRAMKREWVAGIREHLSEVLDRAEAEVARCADDYMAAINEVLARREPYMVAHRWFNILRRFAKDDDGSALRWPGEQSVTGGEIRYQGRSASESTLEAAFLPAVLAADASRHVPPPQRRRNADDRALKDDLDRRINARPTGARLVYRK